MKMLWLYLHKATLELTSICPSTIHHSVTIYLRLTIRVPGSYWLQASWNNNSFVTFPLYKRNVLLWVVMICVLSRNGWIMVELSSQIRSDMRQVRKYLPSTTVSMYVFKKEFIIVNNNSEPLIINCRWKEVRAYKDFAWTFTTKINGFIFLEEETVRTSSSIPLCFIYLNCAQYLQLNDIRMFSGQNVHLNTSSNLIINSAGNWTGSEKKPNQSSAGWREFSFFQQKTYKMMVH